MKYERSYKNYLPYQINLIAGVICLVISLVIGIFTYYQILTITPTVAVVKSIDWLDTPFFGRRVIMLKLSDNSSITLQRRWLPIYIHPGDSIKIYHDQNFGYLIYDPLEFFVIIPLIIIGSSIFIKKSLKKEIIQI